MIRVFCNLASHFQFSWFIGSITTLLVLFLWNWRRNRRIPRFRNSGDTGTRPLLLNGRRNSKNGQPVAYGTIRITNRSEKALITAEPIDHSHQIFFLRTTNLNRQYDVIELGAKESAEFQAEILVSATTNLEPLTVKLKTDNRFVGKTFKVNFTFA